jgi:hypothetical protein
MKEYRIPHQKRKIVPGHRGFYSGLLLVHWTAQLKTIAAEAQLNNPKGSGY